MASPAPSPHSHPEPQVALTVQLDGDVAQALFALAGESHQPPADLAAYVIRHGLRHELPKHRRA